MYGGIIYFKLSGGFGNRQRESRVAFLTEKLTDVKLLSLLLSYFDIITGDEDNFRVVQNEDGGSEQRFSVMDSEGIVEIN